MSPDDSSNVPSGGPPEVPRVFCTTRWSVVLTARDGPAATGGGAALSELCRIYWQPLYAFARRSGRSPHDAEDLTQGFLAHLLRPGVLDGVRREKGRFRSFLLASMKHFMADEWNKAGAQKRGGHRVVSLDAMSAESRLAAEPRDTRTPEQEFDRRWALQLLDEVVHRLEAEYAAEGQGSQFDALRSALTGDASTAPYADLAAKLGSTEGALRVAVHRMRRRYRRLLRDEIAGTLASPEDVDDELRCLLEALSS
jgi:RNA polymerase sigma-70 factor (ECF subfamily)